MDCPFSHEDYMRMALQEAQKAYEAGEVPIGAVLIDDKGEIIAQNFNRRQEQRSPLAHAEILVLQEAAQKIGDWRLTGCQLYVTLEPCPMCLGALLQARVKAIHFACADPKRPARTASETLQTAFVFPSIKNMNSLEGNNHTMTIDGGYLQEECQTLLQQFFREKRKSGL